MPPRRELAFARIDDIMPEVDRLLAGHTTVGRWSLAQICRHLAMVVRHSFEGFPNQLPWVVRRVAGPVMFRRLDRTGRMPSGFPAPGFLVPSPGLDASAQVAELREALALFAAGRPIAEHPLFGRFTAERWRRIHCIHSAHHLSFVLPDGAAG
jgi:hypothetical protein